jgi:hypothetical protein
MALWDGHPATRKAAAAALAAVFALACGGGGSSTPAAATTPQPTPTPAPVRSVIQSLNCSDIGVDVLCFFTPFTTTQRGDLDVTVDWTFPEDSIQVFVSSGTCTLEQINSSQCNFVASTAASTAPKPRLVTARGVAAGTYQVYVGNRGPKTESISIQVGLTTGTGTSVSAQLARQRQGQAYASRVTAH